MAIQSASLAMTTLNSSNTHPKQKSQFCSSITSASSAPAAPESFDVTHVTSSFMKLRGTVSGTSPYTRGIFHRGDTHVRVLLPEFLCNQSPGFCALMIREETPCPLPVGCPTDGLPKLTQQHSVMLAWGYRLIVLRPATGSPGPPGGPFRLGVPYQSRVDTPLTEVHPLRYSGPDLSGPADVQSLHRSLRVPTLVKYPLPFCGQDGHEAAPPCSCGCGIPASRLLG